MILQMPPNNQYPQNPTPPSGKFDSSQFDFIMNPGSQPKKSFIPGGSKQRMLFMIIGGGFILILILFLFFSIFGGSSDAVEQLLPITKRQNEIIRVSSKATSNTTGVQAKKLSNMVSIVISTDQKAILKYMANNGKKVSSKELAQGQNKETDSEFDAAEQNGRFDEVYIRKTLEQLEAYQQALEEVYPNLGEQGKQLVKENSNNVKLLITLAK